MAGVSLDGFNVAPVQFEFVSDARVAEAVENNFRKVLLLYKFPEFFSDDGIADRHAIGGCQDKAVVVVFRPEDLL